MNCPKCKSVMKPLFTGFFCPSDCDRPAARGQARFTAESKTFWVPAAKDTYLLRTSFDFAMMAYRGPLWPSSSHHKWKTLSDACRYGDECCIRPGFKLVVGLPFDMGDLFTIRQQDFLDNAGLIRIVGWWDHARSWWDATPWEPSK